MGIDAVIIAVLYTHFDKMKEKGRKVIPWFQTVVIISFSIVMLSVLFIMVFLEFINGGYYELKLKEFYFIVLFIVALILLFNLIKRCYFSNNRYILFLEAFDFLIPQKQKLYKIIVLSTLSLLPFLLIYIIYLLS